SVARATPCTMASSKLFGDVALISTTLATDMTDPSSRAVRKDHADPGERLGSATCSPAQAIGNGRGYRLSGARIRMSIPRQTPRRIDVNERVRQSGIVEDSASQGPFNWLLRTKLRHDD